MSGSKKNLEDRATQTQILVVNKIKGGRWSGRHDHAEQFHPSLGAPERPVIWMQSNNWWCVQCTRQISSAADMVEMGVGDPNLADATIVFFCLGGNQMSIPDRIDNGRLTGIGVGNQVGVCGNRPKNERKNF